MSDGKPLTPKVKMYGVVRDSEGRPRIDDPSSLHPAQKQMLTQNERDEFGVVITEEDKTTLRNMQTLEEAE